MTYKEKDQGKLIARLQTQKAISGYHKDIELNSVNGGFEITYKDENQIELNIGNLITGKADIVTPVNIRSQQLILAEGTVIDLESKLTPYDMAVHDAICTLVDSGRTLITTRQIAESMTGQRCESKGVLSAVTRSINKMRMTFVDIDYTAHLKAYGIEPSEGNSIIKNSNVIQ